jgi:hypothetical protein
LATDPELKVKAVEIWLDTVKKDTNKHQLLEEAEEMFQMIKGYEAKSGDIVSRIWKIKQEIVKLMQKVLEPLQPEKSNKRKLVSGYISKN